VGPTSTVTSVNDRHVFVLHRNNMSRDMGYTVGSRTDIINQMIAFMRQRLDSGHKLKAGLRFFLPFTQRASGAIFLALTTLPTFLFLVFVV